MSAFLKFLFEDWYFAIPMFLMSAVAITLVIWRILLNHNARTNLNVFLPAFQARLEKDGIEGALRFCKAQSAFDADRPAPCALWSCHGVFQKSNA